MAVFVRGSAEICGPPFGPCFREPDPILDRIPDADELRIAEPVVAAVPKPVREPVSVAHTDDFPRARRLGRHQ